MLGFNSMNRVDAPSQKKGSIHDLLDWGCEITTQRCGDVEVDQLLRVYYLTAKI